MVQRGLHYFRLSFKARVPLVEVDKHQGYAEVYLRFRLVAPIACIKTAQVVVQAAQGGGGRPHCHVDAEKGSKYDVMAPEV